MKDKVLTFIIGLLVGAIITTGVFLIINNTSKTNNKGEMMEGRPGRPEMGNFTPGEMPAGERQQGKPGEQSESEEVTEEETNQEKLNSDESSSRPQKQNNLNNSRQQETKSNNET